MTSSNCVSHPKARRPRRRALTFAAVAVIGASLGGLAVAQEEPQDPITFKGQKLAPRNYGSQYTDDNGTPFTVSNNGNTLTTANFTYTWTGPPQCRYQRPDGSYFEFFDFGTTKFTYQPSGKMVTGNYWKKP